MTEREFIIMLYRGMHYYADDPQTGRGQRRGLLLVASALERRYLLKASPPNSDYDQLQRYGKRKAVRLVPTPEEAAQDEAILDKAMPVW